MVSVRTTAQDKTTNINQYIRKMAKTDCVFAEYFRQQEPKKEEQGEKPSLTATEEVANIQNQWLDKAGLKDSTEALIMALSTWSLKAASTIPGKTPDGGGATLSLCRHLSHINGLTVM